jgi:hypothetical protein
MSQTNDFTKKGIHLEPRKPTDLAARLAELRLLVGYLGEVQTPAWWDTRFLDPKGLRFLQMTFPRTALSAAVHSVTTSAKRLHDERIGDKDVYHLFRLPPGLESETERFFLGPDSPPPETIPASCDAAMVNLRAFAGEPITAPLGPFQVENPKGDCDHDTVTRLAGVYLHAFLVGQVSLPYFGGNAA